MSIHFNFSAKQSRSVETIEIILEAVRLQLRKGEKLNMQVIADTAGVSIGTVYHHFKSKEHLLGYAYTQYLEKILAVMKVEIVENRRPPRCVIREIFLESMSDTDHYYNIREFMLTNEEAVSVIWDDFTTRVSALLLNNVPGMLGGADRQSAEKILKISLATVRAMWQKHFEVLLGGSGISENASVYHEVFADMLVGLIPE